MVIEKGFYKILTSKLHDKVECGKDKYGDYTGRQERPYSWYQLILK